MKHISKLSAFALKSLVIVCIILPGLENNVAAQKCRAKADQIYFVASGQMVIDVSPGSNGGNGYQLNILGTGVDNYELVKEAYMTSVNVIPGYTNSTAAKWQVFFEPNMERIICSVKMKNKCTGETLSFPLTVGVKLLR